MRLTNALVSGIMNARNGGFAVAHYLCRDYYTVLCVVLFYSLYCCTLPMQGLLHCCLVAFEFKSLVAPYLCRDYYSISTFFSVQDGISCTLPMQGLLLADPPSGIFQSFRLHLTYAGIITTFSPGQLPSIMWVAPYLPRYPKAKLPRVSLFFCHPTPPMTE